MKKPQRSPRLILTLLFALFVFCILIITMMVVGFTVYVLVQAGVLSAPNLGWLLIAVAISSIVVGTALSLSIGTIPMQPLSQLIQGMNALAAGKFDTRLSLNVPKDGKTLERSFNLMAEELQNTELLRSDFINNFSHEFKTPLVSIQGFARLLQRGNLSEAQQREYAGIIASESARLADMATKVLDLTRLENQSILTGVTEYNLSEQLRECVLLLERKWSEKALSVSAEFAEYSVCGNREMLQQVWINLLDNAVKFSEPGGTLGVALEQDGHHLLVSVSNQGPAIPETEQKRIFQKFYQADPSHASQGNGIGLAIVHRIVTLHEGEVWVNSAGGRTVFTIALPRE